MTINITEVIRRTTQGRTEPYLCRGENGCVYFVKGRRLPRRELVAEWLAANLASELGLNVPEFDVAEVPPELVDPAMGTWLSDLGSGAAFASQRVEASELTLHVADSMDPEVRALIVTFDLWVMNMDRTLSSHGGNPNLLWLPGAEIGEVVVIDHNLAFDKAFDLNSFMETHVFRDDLTWLASDFIAREKMRERLIAARPRLEAACATIPNEWRFVDPEQTISASWTDAEFMAILDRCQNNDFWNLTS